MQQEPHPLDYDWPRSAEPVRPRLWLSHMRTAAVVCLIAIFVDADLRFDWIEARRVARIEVVLATYGATCAIVSLVRGALEAGDKAAVAVCAVIFILTACVGTLMPRVIHN